MLYEEPSTHAGVYEVELGDGVLPGDRSPSVLFHLLRECPEEAPKLSAGELTARNRYISDGYKKLATQLFGKPDPERWAERRQLQIASLTLAEQQGYLSFLSAQMKVIADRLYDTPPSKRTREQYLGAYARYIRTRQLLGPTQMQSLIWDRVGAGKLRHWKFFADWRNQQRKLRSKKRLEWLAEVHPNLPSQKAATARYNDSEAARHAKRVYAQSAKGKAARAKREAARAKKDADLLATPDDEVIRPEMLQ